MQAADSWCLAPLLWRTSPTSVPPSTLICHILLSAPQLGYAFLLHGLRIYTVRLICFAKIHHLSSFLWYKYWMTAWSRFILCLLVGCLRIFCFFGDLKASQLWSSHAPLDVSCSVSLLCLKRTEFYTRLRRPHQPVMLHWVISVKEKVESICGILITSTFRLSSITIR